MYRQGDILLKRVELLPELEELTVSSIEGKEVENTIILALGEATGHAHAIRNHNGKVVLVKSKNDNKFFLMVLREVKLTHEEHAAIPIPVDNYGFIRQRQYHPLRIIQVAD